MNHNFNCLECKKSFSIESREKNVTKIQVSICCPFCGAKGKKGELEWQAPVPSKIRNREALGRENAEKSKLAHQMAREAIANEDPAEREMVTVKNNIDGKSTAVPKTVFDSIENRIKNGELQV